MVQSLDGKAAIEGKASSLGTAVDRNVMRTLRSKADAVMVGGGTIRAEKLALGLDAEDSRPVPRAVVMTNTGDLPLESNLVGDRRQDVLVLLADSAEQGVERVLEHLAQIRRVSTTESGAIDVGRVLEILKSEYGIDKLLCEGGPRLNRALIGASLADELFVTLAPVLVGASATETTIGTTEEPRNFMKDRGRTPGLMRLISSHAEGDELFLRYSIQSCR
jgi:riboflavin-specific deaminase-like protein